MALESFYGGIQGASFVIVKKFYAVTITEDILYKVRQYAINNRDETPTLFLVNNDGSFIERTSQNHVNYIWKYVETRGQSVSTKNINTGEIL